jgi:putative addiction module CopG family antidote
MPYPFPPDLQQLVDSELATGRYGDENEVLRHALRALKDLGHEAAAIRQAIDAWQSGDDGMSLDERLDWRTPPCSSD